MSGAPSPQRVPLEPVRQLKVNKQYHCCKSFPHQVRIHLTRVLLAYWRSSMRAISITLHFHSELSSSSRTPSHIPRRGRSPPPRQCSGADRSLRLSCSMNLGRCCTFLTATPLRLNPSKPQRLHASSHLHTSTPRRFAASRPPRLHASMLRGFVASRSGKEHSGTVVGKELLRSSGKFSCISLPARGPIKLSTNSSHLSSSLRWS